jgi:hypothetical protein
MDLSWVRSDCRGFAYHSPAITTGIRAALTVFCLHPAIPIMGKWFEAGETMPARKDLPAPAFSGSPVFVIHITDTPGPTPLSVQRICLTAETTAEAEGDLCEQLGTKRILAKRSG